MHRAAATSKWFTPLQLGSIGTLKHRVVLAPLTRNRAKEPHLTASPLAVQYYRQRASPGGLLITEATHISPESLAYPCTPGIWSSKQVDSWKTVTQAVHQEDGFIVCQLWHTGRVAHPSFGDHPSNSELQYQPCVSASGTPIRNRHGKLGKTVTYKGVVENGTPRALTKQEIERICQDYIHAAQNAKDAGFDGVELHAAHGYLIDQFLNSSSNQRDDEYGGHDPENRCRFLGNVLDAVLEVWPSDKVGVRLSPHDSPNGGYTYYGAKDDNHDEVYSHAVKLISSKEVAYLLLTEPRWVGKHDGEPESDPGFQMPLLNLPKYRPLFQRNDSTHCGNLIGAGGFTPSSSLSSTCQDYDALGFGRWFLANPDFPERLKQFHDQTTVGGGNVASPPLNRYDRDTFYTQGADGYTDYPSMDFDGTVSNPKHEGMVLDRYALVEQAGVGTSLKESEKKREQRQSKL